VAVPEPVNEEGLIVAVSPGDPFAVKRIVPENWFTDVTLIVEIVGVPA
jgi:hypothetical protein